MDEEIEVVNEVIYDEMVFEERLYKCPRCKKDIWIRLPVYGDRKLEVLRRDLHVLLSKKVGIEKDIKRKERMIEQAISEQRAMYSVKEVKNNE